MRTDPATSIDAYIAAAPADVQARLTRLREIVRAAAPDATEAIKYQIPTFVLHENLVHFAAFERHVGFYPSPSAIAAFADDLAPYVHAKGSVQFPHDQRLPVALIKKMVAFRVAEVRAKLAAKATGKTARKTAPAARAKRR